MSSDHIFLLLKILISCFDAFAAAHANLEPFRMILRQDVRHAKATRTSPTYWAPFANPARLDFLRLCNGTRA